MPTFRRDALRERLTLDFLADGLVSTLTQGSLGAGAYTAVLDSRQADLAASGQSLYQNAWLRQNGMDLRVASFHTGSGAWITGQTLATLTLSGSRYEVHYRLPAAEKDRALNDAMQGVWIRREVTIPTVDGALAYSLPSEIGEVFGLRYFASPGGSLTRGVGRMPQGTSIVTTGSGRELRLAEGTALSASMQIVLEAELRASLGPLDTDTVDLKSDEYVLARAEADCWQRLARKAPGQDKGAYWDNARRAASRASRAAARLNPQVDRAVGFEGYLG